MSKSKKNKTEFPISWMKIIIALSAFLLYVNSTSYEYTMDDDIFFLKHQSVQKGFTGIGEIFTHGSMEKFDNTKGVQAYRPIHLLFFALEKEVFGENSVVSHFINVLLYVLLVLSLFSLLRHLFKNTNPLMSFLITMVFVVHPLHTEVVASVKSRDELWAGLFAILAWRSYLYFIDDQGKKNLWIALAWYALASFSKESTISWLAIFPLSMIMFRGKSVLTSIKSSLPFVAVSAAYVMIRLSIVGTKTDFFGIPILANILTGAHGFSEVWGTKLELLWCYLRLLIWPWPLSWDYSYNQIPVMSLSHVLPWLSLMLHGTLLVVAVVTFKKRPVLSFSILFYLVMMSPTNNFFIYNTTTLGERLMFVPSLGICMALVALIGALCKVDWKSSSALRGNTAITVLMSLLLLFSGMSLVRSADWKDNLSLFQSGVDDCPNSSRTHYSIASEYFKQAQKTGDEQKRKEYLKKAGEHFNRSVEILPENYQAYYNYALYSAAIGDTTSAIQQYTRVLSLKSNYLEAMNNLGVLFTSMHQFGPAYKYYRQAFDLNPQAPAAASNLANMFFNQGLVLSQQGQKDSAISCYRQSLVYDANMVMSLNNIASTFASLERYDSCLFYLKKGYQIEPSNMMIIENIGAVSFLNKEYDQGIDFAGKALAANPNSAKSINTMINCWTAKGDAVQAAKYRAVISSRQ